MTKDLFSLESYQYELPAELIAQYPSDDREGSRLLVVDRQNGHIFEVPFRDLKDFLKAGDSFVFNNTKVIPARLLGSRLQGGKAEIFLLKQLSQDTWKVLAKPGKKLKVGSRVTFGPDFSCEILESLEDGMKIVQFMYNGIFQEVLSRYGQIPLPHYIRGGKSQTIDTERYQTVFAKEPGAVAAPTAGLHFSREMLDALEERGIGFDYITLHVGIGTFKPVLTEDIRQYDIHQESFSITEETAQRLNRKKEGMKRICVGTTTCRALESAADAEGAIIAGDYETKIFIYPGYQFKYVDHLITNFHLPGSSLLMLVSAFAGYDLMREAYQKAVEKRFRFFSYGDAMLII